MRQYKHRELSCVAILLLIASPALSAGNDEYTKLLIHSDTNNGSTIFVDSGVVNAVGRKFNSNRACFDGDGDFLSISNSADWDFGSGDFTIDFWVSFNPSMTPYGSLFSDFATGPSRGMYCQLSSDKSTVGLTVMYTGSGVSCYMVKPSDNTWHHLAFVKNGSEAKGYLNGVLSCTDSDVSGSMVSGTIPFKVGNYATYYMNGYIDEFRISKGVARWTNNFAPPIDPYASDTNTTLLLHMDGAGTSFTDSGNSGHNVTANGDVYQTGEDEEDGHEITANGGVHHETNQAKFGATSIKFDGDGDFLSISNSADWDFGSGDFTIDFWIHFDPSMTPYGTLFSDFATGPSRGIYAQLSSDKSTVGLAVIYTGNNANCNVTKPSDNTWHHLAFVKNGTEMRGYLNGVLSYTDNDVSGSMVPGPGPFRVGNYATYYMNGYIDEFRISKGIARWTSDFTPPTAPYSVPGPLGGTVILVR